ncbi:MAG: chorismate mutase [Candidatus Atribacteria bacterium]|nr:chorismate mutase [Candidatus Atribacteria bacterium]
MNPMRGIRGAITVERDDADEIAVATLHLFETMMEKNRLKTDDITAIFITVTHDLKSTFPARAIRQVEKYRFLPIMCAQEIPVENAVKRCIRLMMIAFCPQIRHEAIHHVYLRDAQILREDLRGENNG